MSRCSPVYVPYIETGGHVKNNACTVEIKIKWMIRKDMTYENTYRDDIYAHRRQKFRSRRTHDHVKHWQIVNTILISLG
jgi:hypothetical protein